MIRFAEVLTRTVMKGCCTDLEFLTPDTVRWAVYPNGKRRNFYFFNADPDLTASIRPVCVGKAGGEILLPPGAFRVFYEENGILVMPEDPLTECTASSGNIWSLETREQNITLVNLAQQDRDVTVNGEKLHLGAESRIEFRCPALIPPEKAGWMSEEYLKEPEMVMKDCSTPY